MPSPWFPVAILVVGATFALLTRRVGHSPNRFGTGDTTHDLVGRVYRVSSGILFAFLVARAVSPGVDPAAGSIPVLVHPGVVWVGLGILTLGGAAILAAQAEMGTSWRIGLDQERTELMTSGLFAWSCNPTFLGMMAVVLGAFLVAPIVVTGIVLAAAWVAFSIQIRMEEEHLGRMHGPAYDRYRAAAPLWIGLPGAQVAAHASRDSPVNYG